MEELTAALRTELSLLDDLHYRVTVALLVATADEGRFLAAAADEVEDTAARLREAEVVRAGAAEAAARELGLDVEDVTLEALARAARGPARTALEDLLARLRARVEDVHRAVEEATEVSDAAAARIGGALERLATGRSESVYRRGVSPPSSRFDERA